MCSIFKKGNIEIHNTYMGCINTAPSPDLQNQMGVKQHGSHREANTGNKAKSAVNSHRTPR